MDPLTHTLVGANLAATRLGQTTRLAAPALIIGANLPDVDAILYFTGHDDFAREFRRGWTHGVLALILLPIIQTALLLLFARVSGRADALRGGQSDHDGPARPRVRASALLGLSTLAILTHPTLDWLNTYGMRWLMPFDGRWSYGDSVYIMDPWLWLVLGCGWLVMRRPTPLMIITFIVVVALLVRVVVRRSPEYLIVVAIVALALLAALFWRPPQSRFRVPTIALAIATAYIGGRIFLNELTESRVIRQIGSVQRMMAAPHPIDPTRWDVVAQTPNGYRFGNYSWRSGSLSLDPRVIPLPQETPEYAAARRDPSVRGFVTWVRFPWYEIERTPTETRVLLHDARRLRPNQTAPFGGPVVTLN